jgi:hypothetical protein
MANILELEYLFPFAEEDAHRKERVLVRPNSFEDVCDVLNGPESVGVLRIVKAQNRVRQYLQKMSMLKRLGYWVLMDKRQLGRFCVRQICREWECCAALVDSVVVGGSWYPNSSELGGCLTISASAGNAKLHAVVDVWEIGQYARSVVPASAMDIALSVRNAVDFVAVVDCKKGEIDCGGRTPADQQECMLLGVVVHPDLLRQYDAPRLVPLATWPMEEYD